MSGVGGEIGELEELLSDILEAKKDLEAKKEAAGRELVLSALQEKKRGAIPISSDDKTPKKKRRADVGDGKVEIGIVLRESESARFSLEKEKLKFEREKLALDNEHRVADRAEREKERDQRAEEMLSYQKSLQSIVQENGKQVQSVMSLVTHLLQNQNQEK